MEPDPSIFLAAIRTELLSADFFGAGLASGASAVIAHRAAEGLAQLLLRHDNLPELLRQARPAQLELLHTITERIKAWGLPLPPEIAHALDQAARSGDHPCERDIVVHDALSNALTVGLRTLRSKKDLRADQQEIVREIGHRACGIEHERREAYNGALSKLRQAAVAMRPDLPSPPEPTVQGLTDYLRDLLPGEPSLAVADLRRLAGFNSKDVFLFDIIGSPRHCGHYVLRREPTFNATATSLAEECEILKYLAGSGIPVPRVLAAAPAGNAFGGGFLIMERVPGSPRSPETLGAKGAAILMEIARMAAKIHAIEIPTGLPRFADATMPARERMIGAVERWYQRWRRERFEDSLIVEAAYVWLMTNVDCVDDTTVIVHGDFNLRNILLDDDRLSAVLDWELCHISHPAEDLAYIRSNVEPVISWERFLSEYERHAGRSIAQSALIYFEVWCYYWQLALSSITYAGYLQDKHRSFIWASVVYNEYREKADVIARVLSAFPSLKPEGLDAKEALNYPRE